MNVSSWGQRPCFSYPPLFSEPQIYLTPSGYISVKCQHGRDGEGLGLNLHSDTFKVVEPWTSHLNSRPSVSSVKEE